MLNLDTFLYIEKIIDAELELCDTYKSLLSSDECLVNKQSFKKLLDQHKSRYNGLISLLKEEYRSGNYKSI